MTAKRRDGWGYDPESWAGRVNALLVAAPGPVPVADVQALGLRSHPRDYLSRLTRDGLVRRAAGGYEVTRAGRLLWRGAGAGVSGRRAGPGDAIARGEPVAKPLRLKLRSAAALLDVSVNYLRIKLLRQGLFTEVRPYGYGRGRPVYLLTEEVEAYATGGLQGLRGVQAEKKRKK
jgi:hypothetical protein